MKGPVLGEQLHCGHVESLALASQDYLTTAVELHVRSTHIAHSTFLLALRDHFGSSVQAVELSARTTDCTTPMLPMMQPCRFF